jgi:hypothetical protein
MKTMKNKVNRELTETWLGKSLIRVGQKVDEVWMGIGQYLVKSWSAFKAKEVGRKLDKSWTDFGRKKVQQGYYYGTTFLKDRVCQGYANGMPEFRSNRLLQPYSNITPKITGQRLLQYFSNTSPEIEGSSLKRLSQQLPNDYLENKASSLNKSGQNQDEIGTESCVNASLRFRQFGSYKVGQLLGETCVDLGPFYLEMSLVIQPLSFIAHSLIVHNKRVSCGYTEVTPALHQEFSLFDIASLFLYVVLPDQSL